MESLDQPEIELLRFEIAKVHQALRAGHTRLTWNNLTIQESALDIGKRNIAIFRSKLKQVHLIKNDLLQAVQEVREGKLLE